MSPWGAFLLRSCNNNLSLNLNSYWFFPSELRVLRKHADAIGILLTGKCRNRASFDGERL